MLYTDFPISDCTLLPCSTEFKVNIIPICKGVKLFIRRLVLNEYECLENNSHGGRSGNKSPKVNYVKKKCPFQDMILD